MSLVINYDLPNNRELYIHRIGRTARGNDTGVAYSFFTPKDRERAKELCEVLVRSEQEIPEELAMMVRRKDNYKPRKSNTGRRYTSFLDRGNSNSISDRGNSNGEFRRENRRSNYDNYSKRQDSFDRSGSTVSRRNNLRRSF